MGKNIEKLGRTLHSQMSRVNSAGSKIICELGIIEAGMALQPDNSPGPIPKGDYMVSLYLTMGEPDTEFAETTTDGTYPHNHKVKLPEELRSLKVGDRVLIIWYGTEPIVIAILVSE